MTPRYPPPKRWSISIFLGMTLTTLSPDHGPVFPSVEKSIANVQAHLTDFFHPKKNSKYAIKVLLKFKLIEAQSLDLVSFMAWTGATPYIVLIHERYFSTVDFLSG